MSDRYIQHGYGKYGVSYSFQNDISGKLIKHKQWYPDEEMRKTAVRMLKRNPKNKNIKLEYNKEG